MMMTLCLLPHPEEKPFTIIHQRPCSALGCIRFEKAAYNAAVGPDVMLLAAIDLRSHKERYLRLAFDPF